MFDEPFRAHVNFGNGPEPGLLLGWISARPDEKTGPDRDGRGLCLRGDGSLEVVSKDFITVDWRYEPRQDKWIDLIDVGRDEEASEEDSSGA